MSYTPAAQVSWLEPKANPLLEFGTLAAREMYDGHAAVSNASVPKYMVIIGGSHAAGIHGIRARAYGPMQPCMWPKSRISVMGADQVANVPLTVKRDQLAAKGDPKMTPKQEKAFQAPTLEKYGRESSAYYSKARLWDDGIIDPVDIRMVLALGIAASRNGP